MTLNGRIAFEVENALAVVGAACAMGIDRKVIRERVASFASDPVKVPGRFNVFALRGGTVIVDYGHNIGAFQAICDMMMAWKCTKTIGVVSLPGDRSDAQR